MAADLPHDIPGQKGAARHMERPPALDSDFVKADPALDYFAYSYSYLIMTSFLNDTISIFPLQQIAI